MAQKAHGKMVGLVMIFFFFWGGLFCEKSLKKFYPVCLIIIIIFFIFWVMSLFKGRLLKCISVFVKWH